MSPRLPRLLPVVLCFLAGATAHAANYYARAAGNWNVPANWSQVGYGGAASATYPGQLAAGDHVFISGYAITVVANTPFAIGNITLSQAGPAGQTKLDLNTAGVVLNAATLTMTEANVNNDIDLEVVGTLNLTGGITITRSAINNRNKRMRVYARNNGIINVGGNLTYTYLRSGGENAEEILLDNSGQLNVTGNLACTIGNNATNDDHFDLRMNATSLLTVGGTAAFTVSNSNDGDDVVIDMNGGTFNIAGTTTLSVAATATSGSRMDVQIDGATLNANGGMTLTQASGTTFDVLLNSNSTAAAASLYVGGNLSMTHATAASDQTLQTNANASVYVEGNMTLTMDDDILEYQRLDLNGGTFYVGGDLTNTISGAGTNQRFLWTLDGSSTMTVGNNVSLTQTSGGPLQLQLNSSNGSNAGLTVGNDLLINHASGSGRIEIDLYSQSDLAVGRDMGITAAFGSNNEYAWVGLRNNNTFSVGRDLLMTMTAGSSGNNDLTLRQWSGTASIGRDVIFTKSAGDEAYWNQDGGTSTIGRDLKFLSTGGDDCWLYLDNACVMNVTRNMLFDMDGGDQARLYLNETAGNDAVLNITGSLTIDKAAATGDVQFYQSRRSQVNIAVDLDWTHYAGGDESRYRISNNTNSLAVGGDMNCRLLAGGSASDDFILDLQGGNVAVGDDILWRHAAGDDFTITASSQMIFDITGDLTFDHTGGDDMMLDMNNNLTWLYVDGDVLMNDAAGGTTTTTWRMDNATRAYLQGNLTMTATAGGQVLLDMNNTSYMWIKKSIVRSAAPNHFGSLAASNNSTIEFNGSANAQVITDDAGNGGDAFHYEKVVINNTFGTSPQVSTEGTTTIWRDIQFQNGVLGTASARKLVIEDGSTSNGGNAGSYVDGPMKKIGNDDYIFPVGDGAYWARLAMVSQSQADNNTEFDCEYLASGSPNNTFAFYNTGIAHVSFVEHWVMGRPVDTGNDARCQVRLYWENATRSAITSNADLRVAGYRTSNTKWNNHGGTGTGGASGSILGATVFTEFGPITFGSSGGINPLPIELLSFDATPDGNIVELRWNTASEQNNERFIVERSADGTHFDPIIEQPGAGSSSTEIAYSAEDREPLPGRSYYRLAQVDFDGTRSWSDVVMVLRSATDTDGALSVFPVPSAGELNLTLIDGTCASCDVHLLDATGREVLRGVINGNALRLDGAHLPAGTYRVLVLDGDTRIANAAWVKAAY